MVHNYTNGLHALPVVSTVLASGAVVVHRPSAPVCPSLVLPVPFLSFRYHFVVAVVRPWAVGSLMAGLVMPSRCWGGGVSREWWLVIKWWCWGILCLPGMHAVPRHIVARRRGGGCYVVPCSSSPGGPGTACCCPGVVGAHRRHQCHSTRHPPHEQVLVGLEVGGVSWCWGLRGSFLSFGCAGVGVGAGIVAGSSWWGPWRSFLVVVGARHHPLALPNLQAGACSGGNRWWVGVFCFGGFERVSNMARLWGSLGAYQVGIPLLGSPGIPMRPPSLCRQPRIPFERGWGLGGCACASRVFRRCRSSLVEYNLKIKKK
jgi:hypothetical protein